VILFYDLCINEQLISAIMHTHLVAVLGSNSLSLFIALLNSPQMLLSTGPKNYKTEGTFMDRFVVGTNTSKNTEREEVAH